MDPCSASCLYCLAGVSYPRLESQGSIPSLILECKVMWQKGEPPWAMPMASAEGSDSLPSGGHGWLKEHWPRHCTLELDGSHKMPILPFAGSRKL